MPKIVYEVLSNDNREPCDRCRSAKYPRMAMQAQYTLAETGAIMFPRQQRKELPHPQTARVVLCVSCLGFAIQVPTGWNMQALIDRYKDVSPLFGTVEVVDDTDNTPGQYVVSKETLPKLPKSRKEKDKYHVSKKPNTQERTKVNKRTKRSTTRRTR